jgi:indole-3-glycerol phosphate synthase
MMGTPEAYVPDMNKLAEIIETKRQRIAAEKLHVPLFALKIAARKRRGAAVAHSLRAALSSGERTNIIAEFKRRSPSKGAIRSDADAASIARHYESGGAAAISVLTEEDYFSGSLADLRIVRETSRLAVVRKDFIIDEFQIYESANAGADALLLIVAALNDETLLRLRKLTEDDLGMDALVEVHTRDEMKRAIDCGATLIGVNNRNLATFEVSLQTSIELAAVAPPDALLISESGIETREDIERLQAAGYRGFLIGETLMRADDPVEALGQLTQSFDEPQVRNVWPRLCLKSD